MLNVRDSVWGVRGDGVTDDTAALNKALAATPAIVGPNDVGVGGGQTIYFPAGVYKVTESLLLGVQDLQTFTYALEGDGMYASKLMWAGGDDNDIVRVNRPDRFNIAGASFRKLGFVNAATAGTGLTAVRAKNINGIRLGHPTLASFGQHGIVVEECLFEFLDNGLIASSVTDPVNVTIRLNVFSQLHNRNPVGNPATDAPVTGHGNAVFFAGPVLPQAILMSENYAVVQNYLLDSQATAGCPALTVSRNFVQGDQVFSHCGGVRLAALSAGTIIAGNEINCRAGTVCLDLGTSGWGSSQVGSAVIEGNYVSGVNGAGIGIRIGYARSPLLIGNTFFGLTVGLQLEATAIRPVIGQQIWEAVGTKLVDNGASLNDRLCLDQEIGLRFPQSPLTMKGKLTILADGQMFNMLAALASAYEYGLIANGSGSLYFGVSGDAGATVFPGSTPYGAFLVNGNDAPLELGAKGAVGWRVRPDKSLQSEGVAQAELPASPNGSIIWCPDYGGTGSWLKRVGNAWAPF